MPIVGTCEQVLGCPHIRGSRDMSNLTSSSVPPPGLEKVPQRAPHQWMIYDDLMVSFTLPGVMADDVWDRFVAAFWQNSIRVYCGAAIGTVDVSSLQRQRIIDVLTKKQITTAAITDDAVIRGIATAVSWFGAKIKAFSWKDLHRGLEYLGVPESTAQTVRAELSRLRANG